MNALETLMAIDDRLVQWILQATPATEAEKSEMKAVFALRDRIDRQINELVLHRLRLSVANVAQQTAELNALSNRIQATADSIATVKEVLAIADKVVGVAAQVIALVAA